MLAQWLDMTWENPDIGCREETRYREIGFRRRVWTNNIGCRQFLEYQSFRFAIEGENTTYSKTAVTNDRYEAIITTLTPKKVTTPPVFGFL